MKQTVFILAVLTLPLTGMSNKVSLKINNIQNHVDQLQNMVDEVIRYSLTTRKDGNIKVQMFYSDNKRSWNFDFF